MEYMKECTFQDEMKEITMQEMLLKVQAENFRITELTLYLDTHPEDKKAIALHREACKEYRDLTEKYQKVFGPLTNQYPCNKFRWIEEPWPWERGI